ncbi:MAG: cell division protein ZapA [Flavobacteriaceae bacterium]|jgi:cell division protein ZapA|nr:cell division protein ZapA [Flavobacteriaceae bacterium]|tara:strand:+ start:1729 stop:2013 length:285 start_codon:yes stop_codon:yes gene_type:complete
MQKIKLSIADRVYPLSVPEGEEAILREAAKSLNLMVDHFEKNYAVKDKQDVLAMCALQVAVQSSKEADANTISQSDVHKKIVLLSNYLSEELAS